MPVLRFPLGRLEKLTRLTLSDLEENLFRLKCEMEIVEDYIEVEVNPDRPDMYVGEGIARAINGLRGRRRGWNSRRTVDSGLILYNQSPITRPYIAVGVVYNVNVEEDYIEELVQFQEKLHDTIGRRRRKIAIGLHDLSKLPSKELRYDLAAYSSRMIPLGMPGEELSLREVLDGTPQGMKYSSLSSAKNGHPALYSGDDIIAIPPVINSDITKVEPGTKSIFIDVTGTDKTTVEKVLDIITTTLSERKGAKIGLVKVIERGGGKTYTPTLKSKTLLLDKGMPSRVLGLELDSFTIMDSLARMLYNVEVTGAGFKVNVPPFRADVISNIDLIEDIAIAIGYDNLGYKRPVTIDPGKLLDETIVNRVLRDLMIGYGFTEVMQLTLLNPSFLDILGFNNRVEVENPVQQEYSALRPSLIPSLLSVLLKNQYAKKPVKIFEIGDVIIPGLPPRDEVRVALAIMDYEVGFEDMQAVVYSLFRIMSIDYSVEPFDSTIFIKGRASQLKINNKVLAIIGEVSPEILEKLGLDYPVVVAEIKAEVLAGWKYKMSIQ